MRQRSFSSLCTAACLLTSLLPSIGWTQGQANKDVDVLIGFTAAPGRAEHDVVTNAGGTVKQSYWIVPALAARVPEQALAGIGRNPNVTVLEPDIDVTAHDLELDNSWGVKKIESDVAHAAGITGAGVKVAVIDTGIDYTHPDLDANYKGGWDFVNNDANPMDDNGHGTHVSGTIAAEDNGVGVVGVAPSAQLYALKVLNANGSGSYSNIISAVQWCVQNGIQVTNNSYGSTSDPGSIVKQAFDNAAAMGLVMVASAGNSGTSAGTEDDVGFPARYSSVIAVAATDAGDYRAGWSSTGPAVELAAPGVSINSTLLGGGYGAKSGTSMACPHVVGSAAILFSAGVTAASDVRYVLDLSSLDLGTAGTDWWYGYGRVDVATALSALATLPPSSSPPPSTDPPPTTTMSVDFIGYTLYGGGKNNDKNLRVEVDIADASGAPVSGATVAVQILRNGSAIYTGSSTTTSNGAVTFNIGNARTGTYSTKVTNVTAARYVWDQTSPANSFVK